MKNKKTEKISFEETENIIKKSNKLKNTKKCNTLIASQWSGERQFNLCFEKYLLLTKTS